MWLVKHSAFVSLTLRRLAHWCIQYCKRRRNMKLVVAKKQPCVKANSVSWLSVERGGGRENRMATMCVVFPKLYRVPTF